MKSVNRQHLIDRFVGLLGSGKFAAPMDAEALRLAVSEVVDGALNGMVVTETRRVTILLSDLRGFTAISENFSTAEMVAALNRYYERMTEIILRHGGYIDKFMGDAIMVLFGAPVAMENDIDAALACAIEMQLAMSDINRQNAQHGMALLHMGIGINTGEVVAGHLGSRLHSEYTVIGDAVNLASRVEAHSLRGQILLSENTYLLARDFIEVGDVNEVSVKGKKSSVRMYELLAMRGRYSLTAPPREVRNSPRVEIDTPLAFYVLEGKSVLPEEYRGRIVDISYGGMFVVSPVGLEPLGDIKLSLSLSLMGTELTEIYAKVLRVTLVDGEYKCPVEFTSIESNAQKTIKEYIDGRVELDKRG